VRQSIRGYVDGLMAVAGPNGETSVATLAAEVAAVADVIAGSDDLRRALSDPGNEVAARRAVLTDLFAPHVGEPTMGFLSFVLDSDRASDTVADIEWAAERLGAASRDMAPVGDLVLGTKAAEERLDGYATALLQTLDREHALGEVEDELFRFSRVVAGAPQLREALSNRDLPASVRRQIVTDLLGQKATPVTTQLAGYVTQVGRPRDFEELLESVVVRVAAETNRRIAEVRSAVPLDDDQESALAAALGRAVGREVDVRVSVDPSVIAGFVATIGDTVVDGSARHQLDLLKERLVTPEVNITTGERH
jgi:F-type H+-transporting ATPase subunit delta